MQATPLPEKVPAGHTTQSSATDGFGYLPGAHWLQLGTPAASVSTYGVHDTQVLVPLRMNLPPGHALQKPALGPENVPVGHRWHDTSVAFAYWPAAHATHSV